MQNQFKQIESESDSDSEEIYQEMTRDAFGFCHREQSTEAEKISSKDFSNQYDTINELRYRSFKQELLNSLTAELQSILPGAFQIVSHSLQCLSYANLNSWSPSRAYFSLFEMQNSKSIWILHLSRQVGERLAYLLHKENFGTKINHFEDLQEADSLIYLEIGEFLRKLFLSVSKPWLKNKELNFHRCRHILQLGFQSSFSSKENYIVFPFYLNNKECSGDLNLILPSKHIQSFQNK